MFDLLITQMETNRERILDALDIFLSTMNTNYFDVFDAISFAVKYHQFP